jgi:ankyrin repeat domain-containing protein 50
MPRLSLITAEAQSKQAMPSNPPSDPQSLNSLPTPLSLRQLSGQPCGQPAASVIPSTSDTTDLWELAYELFRKQEPELAEDYNKQLPGNATAISDISSRQCVETALKKLLEDREKKQLKISFLGHSMKLRKQVERLTKFLQWSDPFVKAAVSTQPYAALAWSGAGLLLPASSEMTCRATLLLTLIATAPNKQYYAE